MTATTIDAGTVTLEAEVLGDADDPTVVLVHGYPDHRGVWRTVAADLAVDHRVVLYDVRGAGGSSTPAEPRAFHVDRLVDDLVAVLDHVDPDRGPVHLVGHDWGSIQLWDAVLRERADLRLRGRIASLTSISGPALDAAGAFLVSSVRERRVAALARQLAASWYVGAFQVPFVPEAALSLLAGPVRRVLERTQGITPSHWTDAFGRDARHGVRLYRDNRIRFGRPRTSVPVQLVVPTRDAFITAALAGEAERLADDVRRLDVVADHWVVRTHPDVVADAVRAFVADLSETAPLAQEA